MTFNINDIKSQMKFGGARPTLFNIQVTNPINPDADQKLTIAAKAAQLPGLTLGIIPIGYFGRIIKVPGDRDFAPWTTTIHEDEDFSVRNALEEWHNAINAFERNIATVGSAPSNYKSQAIVTQYAKDGSELRIYQFNGIWPSEISPIEVDWDARDQIEQYQVTWQYDSHEIVGGKTGDAGGR